MVENGETNEVKHFLLLMMRNMEPIDESQKKYITFEKLDDYDPDSVKIEDIYFMHGNTVLLSLFML